MKIKDIVSNISKIFYFITLMLVIITFIKEEFIIYGFITLLIGSVLGVVAELMKDKRNLLIILHSIVLLLSAFTIWFFSSTDPIFTMIYF